MTRSGDADARLLHHFERGALALPPRLPSPFATEPHPIAEAAARALMRVLPTDPREGKMFGVLVVRAPDGTLGALHAFSGMLDGAHRVAGFCAPAFDVDARDAFWPAGEAELAGVDLALGDARLAAEPLVAARAALVADQAAALAALKAEHAANKRRRDAIRAARAANTSVAAHVSNAPSTAWPAASPAASTEFPVSASPAPTGASSAVPPPTPAADAGAPASEVDLDAWSRADSNARRALERRQAEERAPVEARAAAAEARVAALAEHKRARSRELLARIHVTYVFANARGEHRTLADIFAPHAPPGGAGDCAAPKLFAHAFARGLAPIALAEFWWGPPPITGDRRHAHFYPACRGKCGPILAHVLAGLAADPLPTFATTAPAGFPPVVHDDPHFLVVDKPTGLLSVPGRTAAHRDSLVARIRVRYPDALVVHRLDLDTSGLVLVAKDLATYKHLQKLFATRAITKRYIARLEHPPARARGTIALPLRTDVDDRPRQLVDPVHGKPAVTHFEVLSYDRVAFTPVTGRTHQLRVHAAHPEGLAAPIRGDRLYGHPADRLYLHAETLEFSGRTFVSPAPF